VDFIPILDTFDTDNEAKATWQRISNAVGQVDGLCFYKHPSLGAQGHAIPDFVLLAAGFQPAVFRMWRYSIEDLVIGPSTWQLAGQVIDSPLLELDDMSTRLRHRFEAQRMLRNSLNPMAMLVTPHITSSAWRAKFGHEPDASILTKDRILTLPNCGPLSPEQWALAKSVLESAHVVRPYANLLGSAVKATKMGEAIRLLDRQITLLDSEQLRAALQIAPGPQRLRGLAGTGKTVLLAMKAATIHQHYPDARILFTFHTQSLYNQATNLISSIYRDNVGEDPNWANLQIRHAWGGRTKPGVYSEACARGGASFMAFSAANAVRPKDPLGAACDQLLKNPAAIHPYYDYILVDEAQDLPNEFFQLLYALAKSPAKICFAYDELQTLTEREPRDPADMFGTDEQGNPRVSLDGEYPSGIEKDLVLLKAYRCPLEILMLAHGLGLGIHSPRGPVQMLGNVPSWSAVGYVVEGGELRTGVAVSIRRPEANSPNPLRHLYKGSESPVVATPFNSVGEELQWVVGDIHRLVNQEGVLPQHIAVITFQPAYWKEYLVPVQRMLLDSGIPSVIPGLVDSASLFSEQGRVTLTTVFRAKGNELPVVYIVGFDQVHSFAEEVESRNAAFTCISRAKGWVKISGTGHRMSGVIAEIAHISNEVPCFNFVFPNMDHIARKLDATETTRRRKIVKTAGNALNELLQSGPDAVMDLDEEKRARLIRILQGQGDHETK
jgi:superfamily I DNA and RNA helicase